MKTDTWCSLHMVTHLKSQSWNWNSGISGGLPILLTMMMNDILFKIKLLFQCNKIIGLAILTECLHHLWVTWPMTKKNWVNKSNAWFIIGQLVHIFEPAWWPLPINLDLHLLYSSKLSEQFIEFRSWYFHYLCKKKICCFPCTKPGVGSGERHYSALVI